MRQNERRIMFIRLRDTVRTAGQLQKAKPFHRWAIKFYSPRNSNWNDPTFTWSLLVYRRAIDFCVLALYPATLLQSRIIPGVVLSEFPRRWYCHLFFFWLDISEVCPLSISSIYDYSICFHRQIVFPYIEIWYYVYPITIWIISFFVVFFFFCYLENDAMII